MFNEPSSRKRKYAADTSTNLVDGPAAKRRKSSQRLTSTSGARKQKQSSSSSSASSTGNRKKRKQEQPDKSEYIIVGEKRRFRYSCNECNFPYKNIKKAVREHIAKEHSDISVPDSAITEKSYNSISLKKALVIFTAVTLCKSSGGELTVLSSGDHFLRVFLLCNDLIFEEDSEEVTEEKLISRLKGNREVALSCKTDNPTVFSVGTADGFSNSRLLYFNTSASAQAGNSFVFPTRGGVTWLDEKGGHEHWVVVDDEKTLRQKFQGKGCHRIRVAGVDYTVGAAYNFSYYNNLVQAEGEHSGDVVKKADLENPEKMAELRNQCRTGQSTITTLKTGERVGVTLKKFHLAKTIRLDLRTLKAHHRARKSGTASIYRASVFGNSSSSSDKSEPSASMQGFSSFSRNSSSSSSSTSSSNHDSGSSTSTLGHSMFNNSEFDVMDWSSDGMEAVYAFDFAEQGYQDSLGMGALGGHRDFECYFDDVILHHLTDIESGAPMFNSDEADFLMSEGLSQISPNAMAEDSNFLSVGESSSYGPNWKSGFNS